MEVPKACLEQEGEPKSQNNLNFSLPVKKPGNFLKTKFLGMVKNQNKPWRTKPKGPIQAPVENGIQL